MDNKKRFSLNGKSNGQPHGPKPQAPEKSRREVVTEALSKRFDKLNRLWQTVESDLKKVPLPVDVSVTMWTDYDDEHPDYPVGSMMLGFAKAKGGWRICCGYLYESHADKGIFWTPIAECTLDMRVKAIRHLPKLQEAVDATAEESVATLDNAIKQLTDLAAR